MSGHSKKDREVGKCPSSAHPAKARFSKLNALYWRDRVDKTTSVNGCVNTDYSIRVSYKGRRVRFPLLTPNKNEASFKAVAIYKSIVEKGWGETLALYKPNLMSESAGDTVGDFIKVVQKYSSVRARTFATYVQSFRKIVADVSGVSGEGKYSSLSEGNTLWRARVDQVELATLTPSLIQKWKQMNVVASRKKSNEGGIVTINSQIRNAKSLFAKKLIPFIESDINLPDPLPFEGIVPERSHSLRYISKIDVKVLLRRAERDLKDDYPDVYKVFMLALICGLRVSEIDHLLWSAVDFDSKTLHVKSSDYHMLKSLDSEGVLDIGDNMCSFLKRCYVESLGGNLFVISVDSELKGRYRCEVHFKFLRSWLKRNGVDAQKPIHTLRKEIGAIIASEQGIYAASRYLRHSDISITASFYADKKNAVIPSIY